MASNTAQKIKVLGLFKNVAVLKINDHRTVMHVGDKRAGNVRLLAANSEKALFEIQGHRVELSLSDNNSVSTDYPDTGGAHQAQLISNGGLYATTGTINQQMANFVVDTGASYVTMSPQQARMLHLEYHMAKKMMMNTANGKATAHLFTLKTIRVGGIELHNVKAAVMSNLSSDKILLGMSFLDKVDMSHGNGFMVLKQRI
ncbi:MAG: retropepsin-like aspartic protease [Gammaproteobacteria bacterium]